MNLCNINGKVPDLKRHCLTGSYLAQSSYLVRNSTPFPPRNRQLLSRNEAAEPSLVWQRGWSGTLVWPRIQDPFSNENVTSDRAAFMLTTMLILNLPVKLYLIAITDLSICVKKDRNGTWPKVVSECSDSAQRQSRASPKD